MSFLDRLSLKRIDAAITAVAESGLPERGHQMKGDAADYAPFLHPSLFPSYSEAEEDFLAKQICVKGGGRTTNGCHQHEQVVQ